MSPTKTIVLAWGNPVRTDDGVGPLVAQRVRLALAGHDAVEIRIGTQLGPELAEVLARFDRALFIDAHVDPGAEPVVLKPLQPAGQAEVGLNHQMAPEHLLALARSLYGRAPEAYLLAVRAHDTSFGEHLSSATARWVDVAAARAVALLGHRTTPTGEPRL